LGLETTIARTLLSMGRRDEAVAHLQQQIEKDKKFLSAYDLLYMVHLVEKNYAEAEKIALRRRDNNPKNIQTHLSLATHYLGMNEPAKMDAALNQVLSQEKDFPDAYQYVGDFFYRVRNLDRAAAVYQDGMKKDETRADGLRKRLIETRVAQGRAQEALDMTEAILKESPKDPEAIAMRASLWLYAGKPEQINTAITELQSVVSKMPENFVLRYNLGRALHNKGDLDGARVQYLDAIKLKSDYLPPRVALAQLLAERGDFGAAQTTANEIMQLDPSNVFARLIQSQTFLAQGKYAESQGVLEQVLKISPENRDAKYQLGFVHYQTKKYGEAEKLFREIYEAKPPDFRGLMGLTEVYVSMNRTQQAIELVQSESVRYPKAPALKVAWGNLSVRGKNYDEAVAKYREVADADPKNWDIHMRIGEAYRQKGDLEKAIEHWKKASQIVPNEVAPLTLRATALETVQRRSEAAAIYEQILKLQPDHLVALNNLSFYLADQGTNLDLALTYAQKAKAKAPTDPNIADTLGYVYLKKNLPQNAIVIFSDLSGKYPKVSTFHLRLANAYLLKGDAASAKKSLETARQTNPTQADQQEIQKLAAKIG
jgi:tetratricopeptide (TPR) repeat protein